MKRRRLKFLKYRIGIREKTSKFRPSPQTKIYGANFFAHTRSSQVGSLKALYVMARAHYMVDFADVEFG